MDEVERCPLHIAASAELLLDLLHLLGGCWTFSGLVGFQGWWEPQTLPRAHPGLAGPQHPQGAGTRKGRREGDSQD